MHQLPSISRRTDEITLIGKSTSNYLTVITNSAKLSEKCLKVYIENKAV